MRTTAQRNRIDLVAALLTQGRVLTRRQRWDEAQAIFQTLLSTTRDMSFPHAEGLTLYDDRTMMAKREDAEGALLLLTDARTIFLRLGAKGDLERTNEMIASLERRDESP